MTDPTNNTASDLSPEWAANGSIAFLTNLFAK